MSCAKKVGVREKVREVRQTAWRAVHTCLKIPQAAFQETCGVCRREPIE